MPTRIPVDTLIAREGAQWKATVFRGRRKLYIALATSEQQARRLAELFVRELKD